MGSMEQIPQTPELGSEAERVEQEIENIEGELRAIPDDSLIDKLAAPFRRAKLVENLRAKIEKKKLAHLHDQNIH